MREARSLLLDTNILLLSLNEPWKLPDNLRATLEDSSQKVFFSAASIWEIAIKCSLSRADFSIRPELISDLADRTGYTHLPIQANDCSAVTDLPWHHKDPFDRLLIAQAVNIGATLVTRDSLLRAYSVSIIFVD